MARRRLKDMLFPPREEPEKTNPVTPVKTASPGMVPGGLGVGAKGLGAAARSAANPQYEAGSSAPPLPQGYDAPVMNEPPPPGALVPTPAGYPGGPPSKDDAIRAKFADFMNWMDSQASGAQAGWARNLPGVSSNSAFVAAMDRGAQMEAAPVTRTLRRAPEGLAGISDDVMLPDPTTNSKAFFSDDPSIDPLAGYSRQPDSAVTMSEADWAKFDERTREDNAPPMTGLQQAQKLASLWGDLPGSPVLQATEKERRVLEGMRGRQEARTMEGQKSLADEQQSRHDRLMGSDPNYVLDYNLAQNMNLLTARERDLLNMADQSSDPVIQQAAAELYERKVYGPAEFAANQIKETLRPEETMSAGEARAADNARADKVFEAHLKAKQEGRLDRGLEVVYRTRRDSKARELQSYTGAMNDAVKAVQAQKYDAKDAGMSKDEWERTRPDRVAAVRQLWEEQIAKVREEVAAIDNQYAQLFGDAAVAMAGGGLPGAGEPEPDA